MSRRENNPPSRKRKAESSSSSSTDLPTPREQISRFTRLVDNVAVASERMPRRQPFDAIDMDHFQRMQGLHNNQPVQLRVHETFPTDKVLDLNAAKPYMPHVRVEVDFAHPDIAHFMHPGNDAVRTGHVRDRGGSRTIDMSKVNATAFKHAVRGYVSLDSIAESLEYYHRAMFDRSEPFAERALWYLDLLGAVDSRRNNLTYLSRSLCAEYRIESVYDFIDDTSKLPKFIVYTLAIRLMVLYCAYKNLFLFATDDTQRSSVLLCLFSSELRSMKMADSANASARPCPASAAEYRAFGAQCPTFMAFWRHSMWWLNDIFQLGIPSFEEVVSHTQVYNTVKMDQRTAAVGLVWADVVNAGDLAALGNIPGFGDELCISTLDITTPGAGVSEVRTVGIAAKIAHPVTSTGHLALLSHAYIGTDRICFGEAPNESVWATAAEPFSDPVEQARFLRGEKIFAWLSAMHRVITTGHARNLRSMTDSGRMHTYIRRITHQNGINTRWAFPMCRKVNNNLHQWTMPETPTTSQLLRAYHIQASVIYPIAPVENNMWAPYGTATGLLPCLDEYVPKVLLMRVQRAVLDEMGRVTPIVREAFATVSVLASDATRNRMRRLGDILLANQGLSVFTGIFFVLRGETSSEAEAIALLTKETMRDFATRHRARLNRARDSTSNELAQLRAIMSNNLPSRRPPKSKRRKGNSRKPKVVDVNHLHATAERVRKNVVAYNSPHPITARRALVRASRSINQSFDLLDAFGFYTHFTKVRPAWMKGYLKMDRAVLAEVNSLLRPYTEMSDETGIEAAMRLLHENDCGLTRHELLQVCATWVRFFKTPLIRYLAIQVFHPVGIVYRHPSGQFSQVAETTHGSGETVVLNPLVVPAAPDASSSSAAAAAASAALAAVAAIPSSPQGTVPAQSRFFQSATVLSNALRDFSMMTDTAQREEIAILSGAPQSITAGTIAAAAMSAASSDVRMSSEVDGLAPLVRHVVPDATSLPVLRRLHALYDTFRTVNVFNTDDMFDFSTVNDRIYTLMTQDYGFLPLSLVDQTADVLRGFIAINAGNGAEVMDGFYRWTWQFSSNPMPGMMLPSVNDHFNFCEMPIDRVGGFAYSVIRLLSTRENAPLPPPPPPDELNPFGEINFSPPGFLNADEFQLSLGDDDAFMSQL